MHLDSIILVGPDKGSASSTSASGKETSAPQESVESVDGKQNQLCHFLALKFHYIGTS